MATVNLGRIKPVFRGAYSGSTAYVVDDIVTHGNESFICIQAHGAGTQATTQTAYWTKLAAKGTDGADGTDVGTTITTQGDILYRDGSGLQRLAKGTAGQALKMNTAANAPEWGTISSDFVKLSTVTASAVASVSFDGFFTSDYDWYQVMYNGYPSSDTQLEIRFRRSDADVTAANYEWVAGGVEGHSGQVNIDQCDRAFSNDKMRPASFNNLEGGNSNGEWGFNGHCWIYRPLATDINPSLSGQISYKSSNSSSVHSYIHTGALVDNQTALSGVTFFTPSGTQTGKYTLYGLKS